MRFAERLRERENELLPDIGRFSQFERTGYDFDIEHVPEEGRRGTLDLCLIWFCWAVQFATIIVGGIIGAGLPFVKAISAILVGNIFLAVISVCTGLIGRRMGLGFAMLSRYPFGHLGSKLPSLICGIVQLGWLTFCYWIFGNAIKTLVGIFNPQVADAGFVVGIVLCAAITVVPVMFGFEGSRWVAYITVPFILVPSLYVIAILLLHVGGYSYVVSHYVPPSPIPWASGVMLAMWAWLFGATTAPDFVRLGKSDWAALFAPPLGLIVGESLVLFLGAITTVATGGSTCNPIEASVRLGPTAATMIIVLYTASMWATNIPTAWTASLQFANIFERPKTYFAIGLCVVAPCLGSWIQFSVGTIHAMDAFLNFISSVIPPVGGIIVAEYWLVSKGGLPRIGEISRQLNPTAYLVWFMSAFLNHWTNSLYVQAGPNAGLSFGIPGLNGFVSATLLYWLLTKYFR